MLEFIGTWWSRLASRLGGDRRLGGPWDPAGEDEAQYSWLLPGDLIHSAQPRRNSGAP